MTSTFRTITSGTLDWRGIVISVTLEKQRFVDHLQIETIEPARAPLPITKTGYRSHFIPKDLVEQAGGPTTFVEDWLNAAAANARSWDEIEVGIRQYDLL